MQKNKAEDLIKRYLAGTCTDAERSLVEQGFIHDLDGSEDIPSKARIALADKRMRASLQARIQLTPSSGKNFKLWYGIAAAAAVFLVVFAGFWFYIDRKGQLTENTDMVYRDDVAPGGNKAILTLADGKKIVLDSVSNGDLIKQAGITISKTKDGELVYTSSQNNVSLAFNTVETPRGGQYKIILPDGTQVWLNAASSLKYPTVFKGKERKVELTGEAYFEVAKNAAMPFHVVSELQTIEVLGTHFNVDAYPEEEDIKTTLLEGSVKVIGNGNEALLTPGLQSIISNQGVSGNPSTINIHAVNTDEAVAWKNGLFQFENADIKTIMNQIGRWYDVDIVYQGKIPEDHYKGKVPRNVNVSQVFKILEISGIKFKIEGKTIIVK